MEDSFDPYYRWLAIPPAEQPPNCYRLLGVALFEANSDVIASAADRQMGHLRTYQNGPYSALSQKLLNEVAQARVLLLQPQNKAQYDERLRQQLAAHAPAPQTAAHPLRAAQSLPTARPLVAPTQPQPAPHAIRQPPPGHTPPIAQPAAHPQPHPAPAPMAAAPPPRPAVHAQPAAALQPSPAATRDEAHAVRPRRKQAGAVKQIVGIVLGGIAGCYIGAVILNFLGAPLPSGVRFLPGMGERIAKVDPALPKDKVSDNHGGPVQPAENGGEPEGGPSPSSAHAWQARVPAETDPFSGSNPSQVDFDLSSGKWELGYVETPTTASLMAYSVENGQRLPRKSLSLAECFIRQSTVRHGFNDQWRSHYFSNSAAQPALIVLPLKAQPNCVIDGRVLVNLVGWLPKSGGAQPMEAALYRDFDLFHMTPKSSPAATVLFTSNSGLQTTQLVCMAQRWKEMYLVLKLTAHPEVSPRWMLMNDGQQCKTTLSFQVVPDNAVVTNNTPGSNNSPTQIVPVPGEEPGKLALRNRYPKNKLSMPALGEMAAQIANLRTQHSFATPGEWIDNGEARPGPERLAYYMVALNQAAEQGDLQAFGYALQRLEAETNDDLTAMKAEKLQTIYASRQERFSPVLFASLCVDVLSKMQAQAAPSSRDFQNLLRIGLIAAREASDRDLQRKLALLAAQSNP